MGFLPQMVFYRQLPSHRYSKEAHSSTVEIRFPLFHCTKFSWLTKVIDCFMIQILNTLPDWDFGVGFFESRDQLGGFERRRERDMRKGWDGDWGMGRVWIVWRAIESLAPWSQRGSSTLSLAPSLTTRQPPK